MNSNLESVFGRENAVSPALAYANHIWKPTTKNFFHGYDMEEFLKLLAKYFDTKPI
jgi:hypothetical protein